MDCSDLKKEEVLFAIYNAKGDKKIMPYFESLVKERETKKDGFYFMQIDGKNIHVELRNLSMVCTSLHNKYNGNCSAERAINNYRQQKEMQNV